MPPTIGIVGGGQLARMLLPAAARLALPVRVLADPEDAAAAFTAGLVLGRADAAGLEALGAVCDILTVEHEQVDRDALAALEQRGHRVRPSAATLTIANDKVRQREKLAGLGISVAPWAVVAGPDEVEAFAADHGWPVVCKRPSGGYDGRGVWEVADAEGLAALADVTGPVLVEPKLAIEAELAVLVARRPGGETVVYPPVHTRQEGGMCREAVLPAAIPAALAEEACGLGEQVAKAIGAVGILAVELFVVDGALLLNELAARPHNTGHPTIEGSITSQFENHLRAVADLPLGSTQSRGVAAMVNVVGDGGDPRDRLADALAFGDVAVHLYGKAPRAGRKLGHVTAVGDEAETALARARAAAQALMGAAG